MNKKYMYIIIILVILIGCDKNNSLPKVVVSYNNQTIECFVEKTDKVFINKNVINQNLVKDKKLEDIEYVLLGDTIELEFDNVLDDDIILYDRIINMDGKDKYSVNEVPTVPLKIDDKRYSFKLNENMSSVASSNSIDHDKGKTIRGFSVLFDYKDEKYLCTFVIRTDSDIS